MEKLEQIITTYQQIIQKTELELQNARKRIYYISLLRLILFVGAVANAIIFWSDGWLCLSAFAVLPFILFIWLVKRHNFWFYRKDFLKKKIEINEQELRAMQYDFSDFDDGKEFINPSHLYTLDLDVFGEHSLFQYINRTATPIGKQHLANWFNAHLENKAAIDHRQEAIRELSTDLEYRQQIRLLGLLYKGKPADTTEIKEWAASPSYYRKRTLLRILPIAVTVINFLCISLAILGIISANIAGGVFVSFVLFSTIFSKGITKLQTTSFDFQKRRKIPIRNKPVPKTIKAILVVEDLSSNSNVEAKAKIPINNITEEIKTPETLMRLAISGCVDANIVASIV